MENSDKSEFISKIKTMLLVVDNNHVPDKHLIGAYALALKQFSIQEVAEAIDALISKMDCHITPAHIINHIKGDTAPLSDSEKRSAAAVELAKPYWERMGFESEAAYAAKNHEKWRKELERHGL